jgi:hypothetical protein
MKSQILAAATLLFAAVPMTANAVTFSVIKVSGSLPGQFQTSPENKLAKFTLNTNALINIALNQDVRTAVPKNIILGYAGVFEDFAHHTPNASGPVQLVVFDTESQTKLKTIAVASARTIVENVVVDKFKRIGTGTLTIQDTSAGSPIGHFLSGSLQVSGTVTRRPNGVATPATLKVTTIATAVGTIRFQFTRGTDSKLITVVIPKGVLKASGKILGTFDE